MGLGCMVASRPTVAYGVGGCELTVQLVALGGVHIGKERALLERSSCGASVPYQGVLQSPEPSLKQLLDPSFLAYPSGALCSLIFWLRFSFLEDLPSGFPLLTSLPNCFSPSFLWSVQTPYFSSFYLPHTAFPFTFCQSPLCTLVFFSLTFPVPTSWTVGLLASISY